MRELLRFSAAVSFTTVLVFAFIEWQIPGFVSTVFPFYWLIIGAAIISGLSLVERFGDAKPVQRKPAFVAVVLCSLALSLIVLEDGGVFGLMKIPLALTIVLSGALVSYLSSSRS
jgi:hypothetical protein